MRIGFLAPTGALMAAAIGCGLISSDITKVTFALPPRTYTVDAADWNIPVGTIPAVPCGNDGQAINDCCHPPAPLPSPTCTDEMPILCLDGVCTAEFTVAQSQEINLAMEVPQLANAPSFGNLSIASISYEVRENSLTVDLPELTLTLAPAGVKNPKDGSARTFGTIPPIPAGTTPSGNVVLAPGAEGIFSSFASDLSKPFTFIGSTTVDVPSGSSTPSGRITVRVTGSMSVSL